MKNPDNIHISLKPIITIGIVIFALIVSGFILDSVRSYSKLKKVTAHANVVLDTNYEKIVSALKNPSEMSNLVTSINEPEKNIYKISFLSKTENPLKLYTYFYSFKKEDLSLSTKVNFTTAINKNETIQTIKGEKMLPTLIRYNNQSQFILVGLPIKEFEHDYGYMFVSVNKTTDLD